MEKIFYRYNPWWENKSFADDLISRESVVEKILKQYENKQIVFLTGFRDFGSLFENYVYLKIKHLEPCYYYENGVEIDFFTKNKNLLEVKYHNEPLNKKQKMLFDKITANDKQIIRNDDDLQQFVTKNY